MVLKKLGKKTLLLLLLPALLLTGCSNNEDTVASMRGSSLSSERFLSELNLSRAAYEMNYDSEEYKLSDEDLRNMANETIKHLTFLEAFATEGEKLKLNPSDEEVEELFKTAKEQTSELLDIVEYSDETLRDYLYKSETANAYYLHLQDSIAISGADTKKYFEENKDDLYTYETADAAHILFKTFTENEDGTSTPLSDEEKANVKKKAEEVLKKVEAGEDFNELAKQYSEDEGTKEYGGELGTFTRGQMVQEFEDATFNLKEGETSKLVETSYGYHIIKLNKLNLTTYNFDDISSYVRQDLLNSLVLEKVKEIEKKYNIKTNNDTINKLLNDLEPISLPSENTSDENTSDIDTDSKDNDASESKDTTDTNTKDE